ncbi:peptide-methionine (S)-S-oxide reductase MsrA, partial [Staphylococcus aureus]
VENPTYEQVCDKNTGHIELARIIYDPAKITYDELLEVFWKTHDPTTFDQQGADKGPQYRSAIFYHNAEQKEKAEKYKAALDKSGAWSK